MTTAFRDWMMRSVELAPAQEDGRTAEQEALIDAIAAILPDGSPWRGLPRIIHSVFGGRGWAWNGIYARHDDRQLILAAAHGPPVCATLDLLGEVGSSGMCWDAILMNQTLVARDVKRWPGYVSCDGESGLATAAGIVCPIRDGEGRPIAVWDLDSTEPLLGGDGPFMDRIFATLSAICRPQIADLVNQ